MTLSKDDKDNKKFYNRTHFFGAEDLNDLKEFEAMLDEMDDDDDEDDDEDDILISENF